MTATERNAAVIGRLGLGTVQFGLDHGVTNRSGQVAEAEARAIITEALDAGIRLVDTAAEYGEAESIIGRTLPRVADVWIVTKTPAVEDSSVSADDVATLHATLERSLQRLQRPTLRGLLVHRAGDLLKPGGERLFAALAKVRDRHLVERIGVSVYSASEIDGVLERFTPEIVQLPLSIADQRLVRSGHLADLKARGIEVHARSLFLQGVLLADPRRLPDYFAPVGHRLDAIRTAATAAGMTPLQACLSFVLARPEIDALIVGVMRAAQLAEIIDAAQSADRVPSFQVPGIDDPLYVDPRRWTH